MKKSGEDQSASTPLSGDVSDAGSGSAVKQEPAGQPAAPCRQTSPLDASESLSTPCEAGQPDQICPPSRQRPDRRARHSRRGRSRSPVERGEQNSDVYCALDLGTNNCRLLVARPSRRGFFVIDAFSRIIRLGEGVSATGRLSEIAMSRTINALRICASKMSRNGVGRSRLVATEACRVADNSLEFLNRVHDEVGLDIEVLSRENEAKLAVSGCASLIDADADMALVSFSRIIRLGEGVSATGRLSEIAMSRTINALRICASKMSRNGVGRSRLVATEACRVADNSLEFLNRVHDEVGLDIEVLSRENEAKLAVSGCASLIDADADMALVFDIGGGSSELIWLDLTRRRQIWRRSLAERLEAQDCIAAWTSLPVGVVSLAEKFGGRYVDEAVFAQMVDHVLELLSAFNEEHGLKERLRRSRIHLLGTSGTVTTVAGIHLGLARYDRNRVDGCWLDACDVQSVTDRLVKASYEQRVAEPCVGRDRADLVLAGCAILEALMRMWPCDRLRVADRGLREGMLAHMMAEDGVYRRHNRRRSGG